MLKYCIEVCKFYYPGIQSCNSGKHYYLGSFCKEGHIIRKLKLQNQGRSQMGILRDRWPDKRSSLKHRMNIDYC